MSGRFLHGLAGAARISPLNTFRMLNSIGTASQSGFRRSRSACDYYLQHGRMMPEDWNAQIGGYDAIFKLRTRDLGGPASTEECGKAVAEAVA